jgi:hypothetical protein
LLSAENIETLILNNKGRKVTSDELYDYVKTISSREDFLFFLQALNHDHSNHQSEWRNNTLEQYLSGLLGFAGDMGGYYKNAGEIVDIEKITWRMAADILLAATVYDD